jgi:transposase
MEPGVSYNKQKLHKVGYFRELLATNQDIDEGLRLLGNWPTTKGASR